MKRTVAEEAFARDPEGFMDALRGECPCGDPQTWHGYTGEVPEVCPWCEGRLHRGRQKQALEAAEKMLTAAENAARLARRAAGVPPAAKGR